MLVQSSCQQTKFWGFSLRACAVGLRGVDSQEHGSLIPVPNMAVAVIGVDGSDSGRMSCQPSVSVSIFIFIRGFIHTPTQE